MAPPMRLRESSTCVAFHSQHKSAGMTFHMALLDAANLAHHMRQPSAEVLNCDVGLDGYGSIGRRSYRQGEQRWDYRSRLFVPHATNLSACAPSGCARDAAADERVRVLYNGYTLAMAEQQPLRRPRCVWLTAFREPTSRLLSSFYYCRGGMSAMDPLCGFPNTKIATRLSIDLAGVRAWANAWGNFLLRELLMFPPLLRAALPGPLPRMPEDAAVWWHIRRALNGSDDVSTPAGQANLERVEAAIRDGTIYDAYAVLDRWNESCAVLDRILPLTSLAPAMRGAAPPAPSGTSSTLPEGARWSDLLARHMTTHASERNTQKIATERALLASARADPEVQQAIAGDVQLYRTVLATFDTQHASWVARASRGATNKLHPQHHNQ